MELLVAMTLLSTIMLGSGLGVARGLRTNEYGRAVSSATTLAQDKIEALQSHVPTHDDLIAGEHLDALNPLTSGGESGGVYVRSWDIQDDVPNVGLKLLTVVVRWSLQGESHEIRMEAVHS